MSRPAAQAPLLNVANVLTVLRLVLVPVFLVALLIEDGDDVGWRWVAFGVFAVAAITDRFDGELARRHNLVTRFGMIADPIADKALMGAALIGLAVLDELPWWVVVVIMGRELGVTLLRFWVLRHGIMPASRGGKVKTLVQIFAIGLFLLPLVEVLGVPGVVHGVRWVVMGAAIVLTVGTGVDYVRQAMVLRSAASTRRRVTGLG